MYQAHDWSEVRRLDGKGLLKRAIARRLAMSRSDRDQKRAPAA